MDSLQIDSILQVRPDTVQYVHKLYNLDNPKILDDSINILNEWIQKQTHFNKKDFTRRYLEATIFVNKGSIERAKAQLDRICTMRTLSPQFFGNYNAKTDFEHLYEVANIVLLPKLTEDHYRVSVLKFNDNDWKASQGIHFYRFAIILGEYIKAHDYLSGFTMIVDFSEANLMNFLKKINPLELKQLVTIMINGYGMRIKAIHIITKSNIIDGLITLIKSVVSAKVAGRIKVHQSSEDLHEFIPKTVLPIDYGGEELPLKTLQEQWAEVLSSEEHLNYLKEMSTATTNESCRQKDQFSEYYAGMSGTFKYLSVD